MAKTKTFVGDTSPINITAKDDDANNINLSATGFDIDLSNTLVYIRKVGTTTDLFSKNPIAGPNGLASGSLQVTIAKTDFPAGGTTKGWYYAWVICNDNAGVDQLTLQSANFEVDENP